MRIAMSILVRDEADVIESNIRHHAAQGVATFIVTDNASVDGTAAILKSLSSEFDITVINEPSLTIDQDLWVTRMANELQSTNAADWVINNDADEFWLPSEGRSMAEAIQFELNQCQFPAQDVGVIYCQRYNLVPSKEAVESSEYHFTDNVYQVKCDWLDAKNELNLPEESAAILGGGQHVIIRTLPGKVITKLSGLQSIDMGNHDAAHSLKKINATSIEIAHYPIRTFSQFQKKVINYGSSIENNKRFDASISLHLRRWYDSYKKNTLAGEYAAIVLDEKKLKTLEESGILTRASVTIG